MLWIIASVGVLFALLRKPWWGAVLTTAVLAGLQIPATMANRDAVGLEPFSLAQINAMASLIAWGLLCYGVTRYFMRPRKPTSTP